MDIKCKRSYKSSCEQQNLRACCKHVKLLRKEIIRKKKDTVRAEPTRMQLAYFHGGHLLSSTHLKYTRSFFIEDSIHWNLTPLWDQNMCFRSNLLEVSQSWTAQLSWHGCWPLVLAFYWSAEWLFLQHPQCGQTHPRSGLGDESHLLWWHSQKLNLT